MKATKHVRFDDENSYNEHEDTMQEDQSYKMTPEVQETRTQETSIGAVDNTFIAPQQFLRFQPQPLLQQPVSTTEQTQQQQQPRFRFQQRSRDMSSPALLSNTITNARNARQSGSRFLDRLRQSRHNKRDRRGAETVEQIDFFQEKRSRAAYFERDALEEEIDVDLAEEEGEDGMFEDAQMSPVEDKEVEDLVRRYYEPDEGQYSVGRTGIGTSSPGGEYDTNLWQADEESEYDQAFMELLSQEDNGAIQMNVLGGTSSFGDRIIGTSAPDRDTEMSWSLLLSTVYTYKIHAAPTWTGYHGHVDEVQEKRVDELAYYFTAKQSLLHSAPLEPL